MRVGIITLYNNNNNYGGIAQAYALQRFIAKSGYECELINYKRVETSPFANKGRRYPFIQRLYNKFRRTVEKQLTKCYATKIAQRHIRMQEFRVKYIPHTTEYIDEQVVYCGNSFDIFVSGSDQIWKPHSIRGPFVLDFVPVGKTKIAYGSSIAQEDLPDGYGSFMKERLSDYKFIGVREKNAQEYLMNLLSRDVKWVVDPVLLLEKTDWDKIASKKKYDEKYVFCYFLGDSKKARTEAKMFSAAKNMRIVTMPFLQGKFRWCDASFGDEKVFDAGIEEFISLIKNAEYVMTDSFHAVVFSYIYEKQFFVYEREDRGSSDNMSSRITSILELMGVPIDSVTYETVDRNSQGNHIDYDTLYGELEEKRRESRLLLLENLCLQ